MSESKYEPGHPEYVETMTNLYLSSSFLFDEDRLPKTNGGRHIEACPTLDDIDISFRHESLNINGDYRWLKIN